MDLNTNSDDLSSHLTITLIHLCNKFTVSVYCVSDSDLGFGDKVGTRHFLNILYVLSTKLCSPPSWR